MDRKFDGQDFSQLMLLYIKDILHKFQKLYKYILVDEFQDVNNLQVELIKLLLVENTQLFCVGDDWQSIYGFRGSNVSYIIEFEKHFPASKIVRLNLNYRSTQHIVGASNEDILFLYRRSKMFAPYYDAFKSAGIRVQNKTIHAAKVLEARVVFIIGLTEGSGGFPDVWLEDRIFQVIKKDDHDLLMEEERRLFYVAITRAKDKLYLITEKGNISSFLGEIPETFTVKTNLDTRSINTFKSCRKLAEKKSALKWIAMNQFFYF